MPAKSYEQGKAYKERHKWANASWRDHWRRYLHERLGIKWNSDRRKDYD